MMRYVIATAGLTAVYALALASADPWDLGIGAALSVSVLLAFGRFILPGEALPFPVVLQRAVRFPALALATVALIIRGTVQVARTVLGRTSAKYAGFVVLPRGERTHSGVVVNGMLETLSPGSVLVEIDEGDDTWTLHVLQAEDRDEVRADVERFYDRHQRPVWP
jgi:multicomponent K+:H+ antiporter subunit E/multicomponent Na+:H+ antiporter subunit E